MENAEKKKFNIGDFYRLCPAAHTEGFISAAIIILHLVLRHDKDLMQRMSENFVRPIHRFMSHLCSFFRFSLAEVIILLAALFVAGIIAAGIIKLVRRKHRLRTAYIMLQRLLAFALLVYALFSLLWGVYYYGDDFITVSGLESRKISTQQLETVTEYFADMAGRYSHIVPRDENGVYTADREYILDRSPEVYKNIEKELPALSGEPLRAKPFHFSKILSYTDFTGFFFPFTAEANVNMDFPPSLFPATVAHELAHQRGVSREQDANFCAVISSLSFGDPDYIYSAALLAYTHLGNALHGADYEAWEKIYMTLDENVLRDFAANREYWQRFEGPARRTMNTVYDGFLKSYDQKLGLKSYGACVDLLVNYYYEEARLWKEG